MLHTRLRTADNMVQKDIPLELLHTVAEDHEVLLWIDLEAPTPDELGLVSALFRWEHLTVEDVAKQGQRAKLEPFPHYSYLVMHALQYGASPEQTSRLSTHELDFIV